MKKLKFTAILEENGYKKVRFNQKMIKKWLKIDKIEWFL